MGVSLFCPTVVRHGFLASVFNFINSLDYSLDFHRLLFCVTFGPCVLGISLMFLCA